MPHKQIIKLSKNRTIYDTKTDAITSVDELSLQDGEARLVRYKTSDDKVESLLIVGTPEGISIINDTTQLENEINNIKNISSAGTLVWEEN